MLNKNKKLRDLFFEENLEVYSCKHIVVELFKHKEKIKKYSLLSEEELIEFLYFVLQKICIIDESILSSESVKQAYELCKDIDESDTPFVALTIELKALLWTGDKKLKEGLKKKGFISFFELKNT